MPKTVSLQSDGNTGSAGFAVNLEDWGPMSHWYEPGSAGQSLSGSLINSLPNLMASGLNPATQASTARPTYAALGWNSVAPTSVFGGTHCLVADGLGAIYSGEDKPFCWIVALKYNALAINSYVMACGSSVGGAVDPRLQLNSSISTPQKLRVNVAQDSGAGVTVDGANNTTTNHSIVIVSSPGKTVSMWIMGPGGVITNEIVAAGFDTGVKTLDRFAIGCLRRGSNSLFGSFSMGINAGFLFDLGADPFLRSMAFQYARSKWPV